MKLGISIGDINGIGLECFIKALNSNTFNNIDFSIYGNIAAIDEYIHKAKLDNISSIENDSIILCNNKVQIIEIPAECSVNFGCCREDAGNFALKSIEQCTQDTINGINDAMLTLPISKESIHLAGSDFPGHTEMIAEMCGAKNPLMVLFYKSFRVALQTIHVPLKNITSMIRKDNIIARIKQFSHSLKFDFGVEPNIAVLGLNPHAGENSHIGNEENDEIIPAIEIVKNWNYNVSGPFPADGFFARHRHLEFNGILAMYHDQGLIPLKMASKGNGVNFTANLPIIRTSPDHGTAFEIAGKNIAEPESTIEAIISANEIFQNRKRKTNE